MAQLTFNLTVTDDRGHRLDGAFSSKEDFVEALDKALAVLASQWRDEQTAIVVNVHLHVGGAP